MDNHLVKTKGMAYLLVVSVVLSGILAALVSATANKE